MSKPHSMLRKRLMLAVLCLLALSGFTTCQQRPTPIPEAPPKALPFPEVDPRMLTPRPELRFLPLPKQSEETTQSAKTAKP